MQHGDRDGMRRQHGDAMTVTVTRQDGARLADDGRNCWVKTATTHGGGEPSVVLQ
ncbi:hypothetical protein CPBF426_38120 [Xanthomonas arboricola pv. juglandis]|nr:hypothetical protein CPBF426_38120 [Xanthomonas arboricola pv. juglandis]